MESAIHHPGFVLLTIILLSLLTTCLFLCKNLFVSGLRVKTILIEPKMNPVTQKKECYTKTQDEHLLVYERTLRKLAFESVSMEKPEHFYDDSDMEQPYEVTIVYHKKLNIPLLSSRNIHNREFIARSLGGETSRVFRIQENDMLCDRLSGNLHHPFYKKHRKLIFALYYAEIFKRYREKSLLLMARSEVNEPLLTKYVRLGFYIQGDTLHNGIKHWVVKNSLRNCYRDQFQNTLLFLLITFKRFKK